jgi:acyl carrier protein
MTPLTADEVRCFLVNRFSASLGAHGLNPSNIDEDFDLFASGIVDSLGVLEMITSVEQHFNISVDFEPLDPAELTVLSSFSRFVAANAIKRPSVS